MEIGNINNSLYRGIYYIIRAFLLVTNGALSSFSALGYWMIGYKKDKEIEQEGGFWNFIRKWILGTPLDTNVIDVIWEKGIIDYGNSSLWLTYIFSFFVYFFMPNTLVWILLIGILIAHLKYGKGITTMKLPGLYPVELMNNFDDVKGLLQNKN